MTQLELKRFVLQAARAARRQYRRADTAGEKLERWLDREIKRKTRIQRDEALKMVPLWELYRDQVKGLERALADFINAAGT
jgi:hypothetical protein